MSLAGVGRPARGEAPVCSISASPDAALLLRGSPGDLRWENIPGGEGGPGGGGRGGVGWGGRRRWLFSEPGMGRTLSVSGYVGWVGAVLGSWQEAAQWAERRRTGRGYFGRVPSAWGQMRRGARKGGGQGAEPGNLGSLGATTTGSRFRGLTRALRWTGGACDPERRLSCCGGPAAPAALAGACPRCVPRRRPPPPPR